MGIHEGLVPFERDFLQLTVPPIILNDYVALTQEAKDRLSRVTTTSYDNSDVYANEPACDGGHLHGAIRKGMMCPECHTPVRDPFDGVLNTRVWIRSPNRVAPLVNPVVWNMLTRALTRNNVNVLEWLTNTDYSPPTITPEMMQLLDAGFSRGYNRFIENFDRILTCLISNRGPSAKKLKEIQEVVAAYRDCVFTKFLPLPNKALLVVEKTHTAQYVEDVAVQLLEVIRMMTGIDKQLPMLNQRQLENRTAKSMFGLRSYYDNVYRTQIAKKSGLTRKNVYGGRVHWSVRAVISSRTDPHKYDEIMIGWGHAVTVLSVHIKSKLMRKHGYSPGRAAALINAHTHSHHPLIQEVLEELFRETPGQRMAALFVRNPTLGQSSVQRLNVPTFKLDPNDPTTSFSILDVKGYNADPFKPATNSMKN